MLELSKWDLDVEANDGEEYTSLVRAVRRTHQRFKLLFVSCSPSQGEKIRGDLMADVPTKKYELMDIKESIDNLYEAINNIPNLAELDVLFIRGLEYSIFAYEDQEFGDISKRSQGEVYGGSWAGVPPVLAKLNMQRELFRDRFSHVCFVFLLPHFAVDYFIRRAPDFYDWKSGIYRFKTDKIDLQKQVTKILNFSDYQKYTRMTVKEKSVQITEIRAYLDETKEDLDLRYKLLNELGLVYAASDRYSAALDAFDHSLKINPNEDATWYNQGKALVELGRYEEAITSYDRSLKIKPDEEAWYNRGLVLFELGRYRESITSYDRAIKIEPDATLIWYSRGKALFELGSYKQAIASYDRAIKIEPDVALAWYSRGKALFELGSYKQAIASYDRAIKIKPNDVALAHYHRRLALEKQEILVQYKVDSDFTMGDNKIEIVLNMVAISHDILHGIYKF
jgi:tetratricopeptide (TPR) repeat protein